MAKKLLNGKRRRAIAVLSLTMAATLSLGVFTACGGTTTPDDEDDDSTPSATDTQLLRNGNFEYYGEQDEKLEDKRSLISTPTSWSFTSGSPSSDTRSGLVFTEKEEWDSLTTRGTQFLSVRDAIDRWNDEEVTIYDRLEFLQACTKKEADGGFKESYDALDRNSDAYKMFADYSYSIDFDDVKSLREDVAAEDGSFVLNEEVTERNKEAEEGKGEYGVLMIHNDKTSGSTTTGPALGTAQYYTSSTTITLEADAAAEVSVWVRTDRLYHWYPDSFYGDGHEKPEVESHGGAYVSVINTLGGSELPEMKIENINTHGEWEKYTVYVRANSYATTTFRIRLGLGQGTSSDNLLYAVNGYAFFDDVVVNKISNAAYETAVADVSNKCDLNSEKADKTFNMDGVYAGEGVHSKDYSFALDLLASDEYSPLQDIANVTGVLTEEDGYESKVAGTENDVTEVLSYSGIEGSDNAKLKSIFNSDFKDKFPFGTDDSRADTPVLMLLSAGGAAYTAKYRDTAFTLTPDSYYLFSFFVKTSKVRTGKTGATVTLVDGENKTSISSIDTTTVDPVTIDEKDEALTDIYKGWVRCFFFVSNTTDEDKTFSFEFSVGPTSVASADLSSYDDAYAAFTNFEYTDLTKTQYGYASTGTYAKKVELTGKTAETSKFDSAEASSNIERDLANPASFLPVVAGSDSFKDNGDNPKTNKFTEGVYGGLANIDYKDAYADKAWAVELGSTSQDWWANLFTDTVNPAYVSTQPLLIVNTTGSAVRSHGYVLSSLKTTVSANSTQAISVRVKTNGAKAGIYLLDTSDVSKSKYSALLQPTLPNVTYWYDDDGNIVARDPSDKDFNAKTDILFYLEKNGLYSKAGADDGVYYANLQNFKKDEESGNCLTDDDTIVYYYNSADNKYYAYYDEDTKTYTQPVVDLKDVVPAESIRYTAPSSLDNYVAKRVVDTKGAWQTVTFYIRTGSEAKTYRLELWAGEREGESDNDPEKGLPAHSYVLFDSYSSSSVSNYDTLRSEAVDSLLEDAANQSKDDPEKLNDSFALYYAYTLYDASDFIRHDRTLDDVDLGSHWASYTQSSHAEGIAWLKQETENEFNLYLDYSVTDVTVTPDELDDGTEDDDTSTDNDNADETPTNIWLVLSSACVGIFTLFAIVAVIVRAVLKKRRKSGKPVAKSKARKAPKAAPAETEAPADEDADVDDEPDEPDTPDDGDPYND